MAKNLISDERLWQAQADADTMARYEAIMSDSRRKAAAVREAKKKATDLKKRADAMSRVGKRK